MNPYKKLADFNFWSRSISNLYPSMIDPCTKSEIIQSGEKVSTLGSCFAQHISKRISDSGLNYYVPECAPKDMSMEEAQSKNYGVFSARYGNLYTVRQALQLFERAYSIFEPMELVWQDNDRFVDPFRPLIEPGGFSQENILHESRVKHFIAVREVCEKSDWIVFTLGLTEAWENLKDGSIYPFAPGVSGGVYNPSLYNFVNFNILETIADLKALITFIRNKNQTVKFLLTVSPVPLIATYESQHVLVSTVYSKSVLRVACEEIIRSMSNVYYFPSYELITSTAVSGKYFRDDLREVSPLGVSHVMRVFEKHFIKGVELNRVVDERHIDNSNCSEVGVICDESIIEKSLHVIKR